MGEPNAPALPRVARRFTSRWLSSLSRASLAALVLLYLTFIHLVGLGIFTHGFLLTRLTIPSTSPAYSAADPAPLPATHSKAVVVIIDALRTDFISPHHPDPASPYHHGVLSLPAQLSAERPAHSLIFNSYSDPPTTTMQRIKGITTGSLPTFIDAGANFASTAIEEDSIIAQFNAANKSVVFMGDDTWMNLFPSSFAQAHPYDSFNVEDLHTVDNGVIEHLIPLLTPEKKDEWDVAIGHFLGVDHVGHRVGPDREIMREKLQQMDNVLREIVEKIDDDTLLVVLGDHGMNPKGDHGGDSDLETAAALWLYSKGKPLSGGTDGFDWPTYTFPGSAKPLRHVNQIDLVPTLSLLLGVPIPYNNLGSVIPECFSHSIEMLETATGVNAEQIERYVAEYGNQDVLSAVSESRRASESKDTANPESIRAIASNRDAAQSALEELRALWAQFSVTHIVGGVIVLAFGLLAGIALYFGVRNGGTHWDTYVRVALDTAITVSGLVGSVAGTITGAYTRSPAVAIQTFLVTMAVVSSIALAAPLVAGKTWRMPWSWSRAIGPILLTLHAVSFASNSFIMWEDRVVVFLLVTIGMWHTGRALNEPTATMRLRILGFGALFVILVRVVGASTVCREEQQPYCRVTFYGDGASAPDWAVVAIVPAAAMVMPKIISFVLSWSKGNAGPAPFFVRTLWLCVVFCNAFYWLFEWTETWDGLQPARIPLVRLIKLWMARFSLGAIIGALPYVWATSPLCIEVVREADQTGNREESVGVFGFGNAFGTTYLLFWLIPLALVHVVSAPVAQLVLFGITLALISHLELVDTQRDAVIMRQGFSNSAAPGAFEPAQGDMIVRPSFTDVVPLALLGFLGFFATGHQAVLATIQWKSAFVGFETVTYPWSPALVIVNTWGPTALAALAVPLLAIWNISPRPNKTVPVLGHTLQMALAFITYYAAITLASAVTAAWLRRHLMVWKVFAPRFMLAAVTLLVVDVAILFAMTFGLRITTWKNWATFKTTAI